MYKPNFIELDKLTKEGILSKKETEDLVLYNYTDKCTYEKHWTKHTINSRGTIYEKSTGNTIGVAFPKFFNFSELTVSEQRSILKQTDFEVFTKEDGSMGVVYFYNNKWNVSTRGSFSSDQALKATEMLDKYDIDKLNKNNTYIVEIIYPENRIILNYGDKEELILLATFETKTGKELAIDSLVFPRVAINKFNSIEEVINIIGTMDSSKEGFVVRLKNGKRFKLKTPEYLKIARIITRMSPLVLWESMVDGKVSKELLRSIPEELREIYDEYRDSLETRYLGYQNSIEARFNLVLSRMRVFEEQFPTNIDDLRKKMAIYLSKNEHELNATMFNVLLKKHENNDKFIMKSIKPKNNQLV